MLSAVDSKEWSESGNAERLVERHGENLRHCHEDGDLWAWDGRRWVPDDHRTVEMMAHETIRYWQKQAKFIPDEDTRKAYSKFLLQSMSEHALRAMMSLAKKMVPAVSLADFDANPDVLNVANGIIDLHTGELGPHHRRAMCTKLVPIDYDPQAECPKFMSFLSRITDGRGAAPGSDQYIFSEDIIKSLQIWFGCCSTGRFEKVVVFYYGSKGDNGKTKLLAIIREALGDEQYAGMMLIGTLLGGESGTSAAALADMAQLKGRRFVTSSEPPWGKGFNVSLIKYLVSGDKIKSKYMYENHFSFFPTYKLGIDTNHPIVMPDSNDAVYNRVKVFPFDVRIPKDEQDPNLLDKLRLELPGILNWIVQGAVSYYEGGLWFPPAVEAATEKMRVRADHFPRFLADSVTNGLRFAASVTEFTQTYLQWCAGSGEEPLKPADVRDRLRQLDYRKEHVTVDSMGNLIVKGMAVSVPGGDSRKQKWCWVGMRLTKGRPSVNLKPSAASNFLRLFPPDLDS